jgi:hypothetical protein
LRARPFYSLIEAADIFQATISANGLLTAMFFGMPHDQSVILVKKSGVLGKVNGE